VNRRAPPPIAHLDSDVSRCAVQLCMALYELPPARTIARYVAAGHRRLGEGLGSREGFVVLAVRVEPPDGDPLAGFRPLYNFTIGKRSLSSTEVTAELLKNERRLLDDPVLRRMVAGAGRHRVFHGPDPRTVPALRTSVEVDYWNVRGVVDRLKAIHAIDQRLELHVGFDRSTGEPRFGRREEALVEALVAGMRPWARRIAFLVGEAPARMSLTPREREALCLLLGDLAQKQHAEALGLSSARARELVRSVYRKIGVGSRVELMARWYSARGDAQRTPVRQMPYRAARRPGPRGDERG